MIITAVLPLFFLYFVLVGGYSSDILNCQLQRNLKNSVMFKHILLFLSIYIFTFVLNWYTFDSLQITPLSSNKNEPENEPENEVTKEINFKLLSEWFLKSTMIYVLFLLTTKTEIQYIYLFLTFIVVSLIIQLILKSITTKKYHSVNDNLFITKKDYDDINNDTVVLLHNFNTSGFIGVISLVCYGVMNYYNKQRRDHRRNWNALTFIFGFNPVCENI
jgi:hypothetical protein